jgi:predicted porin
MSVSNANTAGQSVTGLADSSISSSIWGLRGSEDLGGGLSGTFRVESDIQTNNGGMNQNGLFRRAANVGVAGGFGAVTLGITINPLIATNAALMPVAGNSVSTLTATAMGYADFFTKNAVTYTSPVIAGGLVAQVQYGLSNQVGDSSAGSVTAWSLNYVAGPLALRAAGQNRTEAAINGANSGSNASSATAIAAAKDATLVGASYEFGPVKLGAAWINTKNATTLGGAKVDRTATQLGASYQATPAWLLGASYTTAESSTLTNLQARYSLSKRTTLYGQYGSAANDTSGKVNFNALATNTGSAPATDLAGAAAVTNATQSGYNFGIIHTF